MPRVYHKNPRRITPTQFEQLKEWMAKFGDLSGVVHDLNSDETIAGNQRSAVIDLIYQKLSDWVHSQMILYLRIEKKGGPI